MKKSTNWREPISTEVKLSVTLCYLATSEMTERCMFQFRVHSWNIAQFIPSVCQAIYGEVKDTYLKMPSTSKTAERW